MESLPRQAAKLRMTADDVISISRWGPRCPEEEIHGPKTCPDLVEDEDLLLSFKMSTFPPASLRPIVAEVVSLLKSRSENICVAETVQHLSLTLDFSFRYDIRESSQDTE